jgi:hypothetical protein
MTRPAEEPNGAKGQARRTIDLLLTPRARLRLSLNHVVAGLVLVFTGLGSILEAGLRVLSVMAVVAGLAVLLATAREARKPAHHGDGETGWVEVFAGIMLVVEGLRVWHPGEWIQPALFYFLAGAAALAIGLASRRIRHFRRIVLDGDGFDFRASPFHRVRGTWSSVAGWTVEKDRIIVVLRDKVRRPIRLGSVLNRDDVVAAFCEVAAMRTSSAAGGDPSAGKSGIVSPPVERGPAAPAKASSEGPSPGSSIPEDPAPRE